MKFKNTYLIEFALNNLIELEATKAYIVVGKQGYLIREAIGNKYRNLDIHYVLQEQQNGLMNAFLQALNIIDSNETVVLQLSDEVFVNLNTETIKGILKTEKSDFYCGVTYEENPEKIRNNFSVETDSNSALVKCIEKPQIVINNIKGTGFSIFNVKTIKAIKETYKTEPEKIYDLCDCFNYLTAMGYAGSTFIVAEKEFNINTISDLTEAKVFFE